MVKDPMPEACFLIFLLSPPSVAHFRCCPVCIYIAPSVSWLLFSSFLASATLQQGWLL